MASYEMFQNPWEEYERPMKRARIEVSHLAKRFIKMFKLQRHKNKYRKLERCVYLYLLLILYTRIV